MSDQFDTYEQALKAAKTRNDLYWAIVNAPYQDKVFTTHLGLGIIVLLLKNSKTQTLDRIALSDTEFAVSAVRMSTKPFHEIKIPLDATNNILIQTLNTNKPQQTDDWKYLFTPVLSPQDARFNQNGAGIEFSVTYPLSADKKQTIGVMIFSYFSDGGDDMRTQHEFMQSVSSIAANYL